MTTINVKNVVFDSSGSRPTVVARHSVQVGAAFQWVHFPLRS